MLGNWIRQTTTTTGTGPLSITAVEGYPTFNDVVGVNRRVAYTLMDDTTGVPIEDGVGYLSDPATWVREKVNATFVGGVYDDTSPATVNLTTGTYRLICSASAESVQAAAKGVNRTVAAQKLVFSQHLTVHNGSSTSYPAAANRLLFTPFWLTASAEVDAIAARCGTGVAGANLRLGLYDSTPDGHPGKLLGETAALSAATSGVDVIGTLSAPVRVQPGWYFVAVLADASPALGSISNGGQLQSFMGMNAGNILLGNSGLYVTYAFGAMPAIAPTANLSAWATSNAIPAVALRLV